MVLYFKERLNRSKIVSVKIEIKGFIIAFVLAITLSSMEMLYQNPVQGQTVMYKCNHDMGINVSMVNCLTNTTSDRYNDSMVAELRQNQTGQVAQEEMDGTSQTATQGMKSAMNETGEVLSNATGGVMEGIKDFVNGSS